MREKILSLFLFLILVLLFPSSSLAKGEFESATSIFYDVSSDGTTTVTHRITLTNLFSEYYATSYAISLTSGTLSQVSAHQGTKLLKTELLEKENDVTEIKVYFDEAVVGKGEKREFSISYRDKSITQKTGEIWEITIPKSANAGEFSSYKVTLSVPVSFGKSVYFSPEPVNRSEGQGKLQFNFEGESALKNGITAAFGKFQVFSFDLSYHLENPLGKNAYVDIAIPPDTAYQKITLQKMSPEPEEVYVDDDGNFLARYFLKSRERVDVKALGTAQIFSDPLVSFPKPSIQTLENSKAESEYWQSRDAQIVELAQKLKTPKAIYDYVLDTLSYDYSRVAPNVQRMGAKNALANPKNAICMEFTDLFIAIARSAGIPAREVNGFAYTQNPKIEPLSLVSDVLHAWPEYWDETKKAWIPVDPTWGKTTGGVDFFSKFDLRHFAFVFHSKDPQKPYPPGSYKLGANPQKDVFVSFGSLPDAEEAKADIVLKKERIVPFSPSIFTAKIVNLGATSLYNQEVSVFFDKSLNKKQKIILLPPYGNFSLSISVPFEIFGRNTPSVVKVEGAGATEEITLDKKMALLFNALISAFFAFFLFSLLFLLFKLVRKKIWKR